MRVGEFLWSEEVRRSFVKRWDVATRDAAPDELQRPSPGTFGGLIPNIPIAKPDQRAGKVLSIRLREILQEKTVRHGNEPGRLQGEAGLKTRCLSRSIPKGDPTTSGIRVDASLFTPGRRLLLAENLHKLTRELLRTESALAAAVAAAAMVVLSPTPA